MSRKKRFDQDEKNGHNGHIEETAAEKSGLSHYKDQFGNVDPVENGDTEFKVGIPGSNSSSSGDDWTVHDFTESKD
jgi:hypothetical protein